MNKEQTKIAYRTLYIISGILFFFFLYLLDLGESKPPNVLKMQYVNVVAINALAILSVVLSVGAMGLARYLKKGLPAVKSSR